MKKAVKAFENILPQFLVVFLLVAMGMAVLDTETISLVLGKNSGVLGVLAASLIGSVTLIPGFVAFPVAAILMKKGAGFTNILIFIGAWSTTKIPMLLFESSALGVRFALSRLAIDIVGIVLIAQALKAMLSQEEIARLYVQAEKID
jgi:uncharacterized membrane protein YraQ (UPF0718 family)